MTLTEFLLARIAEDEAGVRDGTVGIIAISLAARILAECGAKRRILALHASGQPWCECGVWDTTEHGEPGYEICPTLRLLALPYADHPDYDQEWRPS